MGFSCFLAYSEFVSTVEKMAIGQLHPVTTEKYVPFQLGRARFASVFGLQIEPLVITGSVQEEVSKPQNLY